MSNQYELLQAPRFRPLFWTQFLGAFNDNLYKNAPRCPADLPDCAMDDDATGDSRQPCRRLFILPFFLFSATAGQLADKYDKAWLSRLTKLLEVVIMGSPLSGSSCTAWSCSWRPVPARPAVDTVRAGKVRDPAAAPARR